MSLKQRLIPLIHRVIKLCPGSIRLPILSWAYNYVGWEKEVQWLKKIGPCRGLAIDVGANQGLYTIALSRLYNKVVAFEPNSGVASPLISARLKNVEILHSGLSCDPGSATLFIPIVNSIPLPGWGSLDSGNCPEAADCVSKQINLRTLDSFVFENLGFIKIDVEGHEIEVLQGGTECIKRDRPHLLVEVRESNLRQVREMLFGWRYREVSLQQLGGPTGSPENHIFVPSS